MALTVGLRPRTSDVPEFQLLELVVGDRTIKYRLDLSAPTQRLIYEWCQTGLTYEAVTVLFLESFLKPGDVFVDVGSHIGFFTMIGASLVGPSGRVLAFEPNQSNFDALLHNAELNGFQNITAINAAVGETEGEVRFYENLDCDGGHAMWSPGLHPFNSRSRVSERSLTVPQVTIDATAQRLGINRIKAVKIDAEGAETKVIGGARWLLAEAGAEVIACEISPFALEAMGSSATELIRSFYTGGYRGYISEDEGSLKELSIDSNFRPQGDWLKRFEELADNVFFVKSDRNPFQA